MIFLLWSLALGHFPSRCYRNPPSANLSPMSDPYFQSLFADRIGGANYGKGTAIYKFEKIKRAKRKALADHPERKLLDFGIGENDAMAPEVVRRRMAEEINKPENRGYADNGIPAFREAVARFMQREFNVALDPPTEISPCIGSKNALAMLPACFINPGDITLMTVPGYPIAGTHTAYYGGVVYKLPLTAENDFLPDLDGIPADIRAKAKLLVLCYPNSPTGRTAPPEFYERAIAFAKKHDIVIIQDAAHGVLSYDRKPNSFLAIPGARDVGVEVHSMSKAFDMIGWRIGWVCGNERIVSAYGNVKDNFDSGQFIAIQKAAIAGLDDPEIPNRTRTKYKRRLEKLVATLGRCGFKCKMPGGTYFLYAPSPKAFANGKARRRPHRFRKRRSRQPIPDHRAIDLHRPLGRRRPLPPLQRHLRSRRRKSRRRPHGRNRSAAQEHSAGVLERDPLSPFSSVLSRWPNNPRHAPSWQILSRVLGRTEVLFPDFSGNACTLSPAPLYWRSPGAPEFTSQWVDGAASRPARARFAVDEEDGSNALYSNVCSLSCFLRLSALYRLIRPNIYLKPGPYRAAFPSPPAWMAQANQRHRPAPATALWFMTMLLTRWPSTHSSRA